jgi:hypothetical protein
VQGSCCRRHCGPVDPGEELAHGLCGGDQSSAVSEPVTISQSVAITVTIPLAKPITYANDTEPHPNHAVTDTHHAQPVAVS